MQAPTRAHPSPPLSIVLVVGCAFHAAAFDLHHQDAVKKGAPFDLACRLHLLPTSPVSIACDQSKQAGRRSVVWALRFSPKSPTLITTARCTRLTRALTCMTLKKNRQRGVATPSSTAQPSRMPAARASRHSLSLPLASLVVGGHTRSRLSCQPPVIGRPLLKDCYGRLLLDDYSYNNGRLITVVHKRLDTRDARLLQADTLLPRAVFSRCRLRRLHPTTSTWSEPHTHTHTHI